VGKAGLEVARAKAETLISERPRAWTVSEPDEPVGVHGVRGVLDSVELSPTVAEILETTHLNELFNIYATEQAALQSFS
jgi:hypothetical protein